MEILTVNPAAKDKVERGCGRAHAVGAAYLKGGTEKTSLLEDLKAVRRAQEQAIHVEQPAGRLPRAITTSITPRLSLNDRRGQNRSIGRLDVRTRGFNRSVDFEPAGGKNRAVFRYETERIQTDEKDTREAQLIEPVWDFQARGYRHNSETD